MKKKIQLIEVQAYTDHIHMLVSILLCLSVAQCMKVLKSRSGLKILDRNSNLKYRYVKRNFWEKGYFVDTVERNEKRIKEYIRNQLKENDVLERVYGPVYG